MRVTSNTFPSALVDQLGQLAARQNSLQNQVSTGQKVQNPEDDPNAVHQILDMQSEAGAAVQYQNNIAVLKQQSQMSYAGVQALQKVSDRANEIATLADSTKSPAELQAYAQEVSQLIQQGVQAANTQFQGDYLFGGTSNQQAPFTLQMDGNNRPASVAYNGNSSVASAEVAEGVTVSAQIPGANSTGSGAPGLITDSRSGADLFNHLISLQNHLLSGDVQAIANTDRSQLSNDENNLINHVSNIGAVQNRLDAANALATSRTSSLQQLVSQAGDADIAQTIVQLNQAQNAYQAALESGSRILNMSLLNYLQ